MTLAKTEFVILDVETTGLAPSAGDRIIEIAALKIKDGQPADRFYSLVDPLRPISYGAFLVNQISAQMLEGAPSANQILPKFLQFLGKTCLVGHNIQFDISFVAHELSLAGDQFPNDVAALDTVRMARYLLPDLGRYNLASVAQSLAIEVEQRHRAMADVELTWQVFRYLLQAAQRQDINDLGTLLRLFGKGSPETAGDLQSYIVVIEQAIAMARSLEVVYAATNTPAPTVRKVTPRKLIGLGPQATLVGYCHLRKEERHFKLERILSLTTPGV